MKDVRLHKKQGLAYKLLTASSYLFVLFGGGARGGKSWLGWFWIVSLALEHDGTRWFVGRDELKRLRGTTLQTFFKMCKEYGISKDLYRYNGQDHYIEFINGSRIDLLELKYKPSDPLFQRFGSSEYTGGWIEEAGEVDFGAFDVLKTRVGQHLNDEYGIKAKILLTCNPAKNWLYTTFYLPNKKGTLPKDYYFIQSLYDDNPFREKGTEEQLESLVNEAQKQRLKFGNWEFSDDPDALVTYTELMDLADVDHIRGVNYCGADIARMGDDSTTFIKCNGNWFKDEWLKTYSKFDTAEVANKLINYLSIEAISAENCGIDTVGLGAGVYDNMNEKGIKAVEVVSGAKATKSLKIGDGNESKTMEFKNLRSQMWWQFREDCKNGRIRLNSNDEELLTDLTAPRYKIVNEKMIQVEAKDDIKKRIGRSPDKGDALVYCNAMRNGIVKRTKKLQIFSV